MCETYRPNPHINFLKNGYESRLLAFRELGEKNGIRQSPGFGIGAMRLTMADGNYRAGESGCTQINIKMKFIYINSNINKHNGNDYHKNDIIVVVIRMTKMMEIVILLISIINCTIILIIIKKKALQ